MQKGLPLAYNRDIQEDKAPTFDAFDTVRDSHLIDYRRVMSLKRRVLEALTAWIVREQPAAYEEFRQEVESQPGLEDYAEFRAAGERSCAPWPAWSERPRGGRLEAGDYEVA